MQGKVALEEHFAIPETLQDSAGFAPEADWPELKGRLLDVQDRRLREMDAHGIEMMLLSLNAPAVQAIPSLEKANEIARRSNDFMAEQIVRQPKRFAGLAALPMQTPELATRELTRCVRELGFCGALVNGFSQVTDNPFRHLLRREGLLAVLGRGRAARRAVLSASRETRCPRMRRFTKAIAGC